MIGHFYYEVHICSHTLIGHFYYEVHSIYAFTHSLIPSSFTRQSAPHVSQARCRVRINGEHLCFAVNDEKWYLVFSVCTVFGRCTPTAHWNSFQWPSKATTVHVARKKSTTSKTTVPSRESTWPAPRTVPRVWIWRRGKGRVRSPPSSSSILRPQIPGGQARHIEPSDDSDERTGQPCP